MSVAINHWDEAISIHTKTPVHGPPPTNSGWHYRIYLWLLSLYNFVIGTRWQTSGHPPRVAGWYEVKPHKDAEDICATTCYRAWNPGLGLWVDREENWGYVPNDYVWRGPAYDTYRTRPLFVEERPIKLLPDQPGIWESRFHPNSEWIRTLVSERSGVLVALFIGHHRREIVDQRISGEWRCLSNPYG